MTIPSNRKEASNADDDVITLDSDDEDTNAKVRSTTLKLIPTSQLQTIKPQQAKFILAKPATVGNGGHHHHRESTITAGASETATPGSVARSGPSGRRTPGVEAGRAQASTKTGQEEFR